MGRRPSPIQAHFSVPEDFVEIAQRLYVNAIDQLLGYVWGGFDRLAAEGFHVDGDDSHVEDDITYCAFCRIQDIMYFSPFQVVHQPPEIERQKDAGQSPRSDLGFRLRGGNVRSHFTIEAKVIRTDRAVAPYVAEVRNNLLTGRYSTFSSQAAMLGYLLSGNPENTFAAIEEKLDWMVVYPPFAGRNHRYSDHKRVGDCNGWVPPDFRCHHMIIVFS